ncbi:MAG: flagellar hook-length control protein FliK [Alphaproteobacteria bacterium]|nr:flagellar hook-length control protein FliK [Alphaproteobacteria bacterium]
MATVAANIISTQTSQMQGANPAKPAGNDTGKGDAFAAMLDSVSAANDAAQPADDTAKPVAKVDVKDAKADDSKATDGDAGACAPVAATTTPDDMRANLVKLASEDDAGEVEDAETGDTPTPAKDSADDTSAPAVVDPTIIPVAAPQPVAASSLPASVPAASLTAAAAPTSSAAETGAPAVDSTTSSTDLAAAPMMPAGTTLKPTKPNGTSAPARTGISDSETSQAQGSTADAVADAGAATQRNFSEQQIANVLPVHGSAQPQPHAATNGAAPSGDAKTTDASTVQPAATPTPEATAAPAVSPSQQPAPAPQADPGTALASISAPNATNTAGPIHHPAQIQLATAAPQQATPNLGTLAVNIATHAADGIRHFAIRLDPPELGRVDVRLTVDDAGQAQAHLTVEKPQTLELLQKDQTHLERALKDAGLDLARNALNFSLKGQQQQAGQQQGMPRGRNMTARQLAAIDTVSSTASLAGLGASDARLDIRV